MKDLKRNRNFVAKLNAEAKNRFSKIKQQKIL